MFPGVFKKNLPKNITEKSKTFEAAVALSFVAPGCIEIGVIVIVIILIVILIIVVIILIVIIIIIVIIVIMIVIIRVIITKIWALKFRFLGLGLICFSWAAFCKMCGFATRSSIIRFRV